MILMSLIGVCKLLTANLYILPVYNSHVSIDATTTDGKKAI